MAAGEGPVVAISGYYGFDNLGDEAVLYSLLEALREAYPTVRPVVLSHAPERTSVLYGVEAVNRWRVGEVYRALTRADLLLSGGGSLLQDVTGLKSLVYYLGVVWLARRLGKPVVFYAQGIGPVKSKTGRLLMRLVANDVQLITVRDENSARDLAEMGVTRPPVEVTADPVLGLDPARADREKGMEILERMGILEPPVSSDQGDKLPDQGDNSRPLDKGGTVPGEGGAVYGTPAPVVGVSVREWPGFGEKQQRDLARVCDDFCRRGYRVLFIPLQYPEDLTVSRQVAAMMRERAAVLDRGLTVGEAVSLVACLELLIGMRLHALILAAVMGAPLVGISYDPKIDRFLARLGLKPAGEATGLEYTALRRAVDEVLADPAGFRARLARVVGPLRERARATARLAGALMEVGGRNSEVRTID
ncbi:polysaccharide pyruvyl transferase CsaB [Desulfofundulus thermosubterraneus]|uniref:Polysaccharide pyruvyl transferase CsaB n=1 Tax=Desulfofundulus thermosubterraneus DSM 16057 TaxID=1121432 RepID=A0A1M6I1L0_9FIRM|nr:polysaccharide pyruvyl transferase CsaB [Desulfofundulus thermosubterraneus]SHJ28134.1 polysaccharide pyruvyl transferase CsaB [Desulfofundulus thermosubterraneus DSM 16057]